MGSTGSSASSCSALSAYQRIPFAHLAASARADFRVLPISRVMIRAMDSLSSSSRSAARRISSARSAKEVVREVWNVAWAVAMASETWALVCASKVLTVSPVAGFWVAMAMGAIVESRPGVALIGGGSGRPGTSQPSLQGGQASWRRQIDIRTGSVSRGRRMPSGHRVSSSESTALRSAVAIRAPVRSAPHRTAPRRVAASRVARAGPPR